MKCFIETSNIQNQLVRKVKIPVIKELYNPEIVTKTWVFRVNLAPFLWIAASTFVPESALKWSLPETWQDIEKGWGGYNQTIPGPGDDVLILPSE